MAYRKVTDISLASVADAIRTKGGASEQLVFPEGFVSAIESIDVGEVVLESAGVAFSSEKVDPDVNYKVGRNWLADLAEITQKMVGKSSDMTLEDMIYWLNRVQFIPQGNAESSFSLVFESVASGLLPDVQIGTAVSSFSLVFESVASGVLVEGE